MRKPTQSPQNATPSDGTGGFGRRQSNGQQKIGTEASARLEAKRAVADKLIAEWLAAPPAQRPAILLRVRVAQDQIRAVRVNHPRLAELPSEIAWVDHWNPAE